MTTSRSFARLSTLVHAWSFFRLSLKGPRWRDKWLMFLLCSLASAGRHRKKGRAWLLARINACAKGEFVSFRSRPAGVPEEIRFEMRRGNECDYLIGGELVQGIYSIPDFTPQTIVDGGANIGMFSLLAAACFPGVPLTCYEPDTDNVTMLRKNLAANRMSAEMHQQGLWGKECTLYFHAQGSNIGYVDDQPTDAPIPCVLPAIGPECWLKLDVEAAEYEVLPALFALGRYPRWITMEIHYFDTRGQGLMELLRTHGYQVTGGEDLTANCVNISAQRVSK